MTNLVDLRFQHHPVRVFIHSECPWFVAGDVADILGYRDAPNMVRNLDEDETATQIVSSSGQNRELTIISESGLYNAIFRSRRPEARAFRKWVTSEVLPSIRRTGAYRRAERPTMQSLFARLDAYLADRATTSAADVAAALSLSRDPATSALVGQMLRALGWRKMWVRGDRPRALPAPGDKA